MKLHEYQAREIFIKYGVPVPKGEVAATPEQVEEICKKFGIDTSDVMDLIDKEYKNALHYPSNYSKYKATKAKSKIQPVKKLFKEKQLNIEF